jgi:lipopolysaccharide transport system permease protein
MVGIIDGFRWSLLRGQVPFQLSAFLISAFVTAVLLASGLWYFRKVERTFADII